MEAVIEQEVGPAEVREQTLNHVESIEQDGRTVHVEFDMPRESKQTSFTDAIIISVEEQNA